MRAKQIGFYPSEYDTETLELLRVAYPHLDQSGIIRELMRQWRVRNDTGNRKDQKLDRILDLCNEIQQTVTAIVSK